MLQTRQGGRRSLHAECKAPQGHASQPWLGRPGTPMSVCDWPSDLQNRRDALNRLVVALELVDDLELPELHGSFVVKP